VLHRSTHFHCFAFRRRLALSLSQFVYSDNFASRPTTSVLWLRALHRAMHSDETLAAAAAMENGEAAETQQLLSSEWRTEAAFVCRRLADLFVHSLPDSEEFVWRQLLHLCRARGIPDSALDDEQQLLVCDVANERQQRSAALLDVERVWPLLPPVVATAWGESSFRAHVQHINAAFESPLELERWVVFWLMCMIGCLLLHDSTVTRWISGFVVVCFFISALRLRIARATAVTECIRRIARELLATAREVPLLLVLVEFVSPSKNRKAKLHLRVFAGPLVQQLCDS